MSNIKTCFTSRYKQGHIIEMDFSQLEVIGLATLSQDKQLISDLKSGLDLHCVNAANLYDEEYVYVKTCYDDGDPKWVERRKKTKPFSFQLQYGAGAKSMAEDNGVTVKFAQKFIDGYFRRYPQVKIWQEENIELVKQFALPSGKKSANGYPVNNGWLESPSGRTYQFSEYDAPDFMVERGTFTSFSPTQIKNYPVQGFSTGDLVPLAFTRVAQWLTRNGLQDIILLTNTIHDSLIFDVPSFTAFGTYNCTVVSGWTTTGHKILTKKELNLFGVLRNLKTTLESIGTDANKVWPDANINLPLNVDVKSGFDWGNMKHLDLSGAQVK